MAIKRVNANLDSMLMRAEAVLLTVISTTSKKINQYPHLEDWMYIHHQCNDLKDRLKHIRKAFTDYRFMRYQTHMPDRDLQGVTNVGRFFAITLVSGATVFKDSEGLYSEECAFWYCSRCIKIGLASILMPQGRCDRITHYACAYCGFSVTSEDKEKRQTNIIS